MRVRGTVFGEVADDYDRIRPGYPVELADELLGLAGGPVLEVGSGTGKATRLFARDGVDLTCVEPDARMAEVLRRNLPGVEVVESAFEDWTPPRPYGLLVSGQAWHWVDPARRADLAFAALAPGGLFAPFWNVFLVADPGLHAALAEVDARHGLTGHTSHRLSAAGLVPLGEFEQEWADLGLTDGRFTGLRSLRYESVLSYDAEQYREYLMSTSLLRMLDPIKADVVLDETIAVIEGSGGVVDFKVCTDVALAQRV
ncbi:class I SAM-dependent methyltransferase [Paractinoplanes lichenicola]|uniref:Class I SAM-dependent methyltransferase n=1 Tax=Paractinoplanes lichenicola TaxID=2802976 RepID=A0ABS1VX33_9ACTN|nr:class I SAM-dependent methyltransferase [Actinoplanes lichenicola]MBL7259054.1 class I SAM-dependent methyltransferase [Actinoplanes lichenicola]